MSNIQIIVHDLRKIIITRNEVRTQNNNEDASRRNNQQKLTSPNASWAVHSSRPFQDGTLMYLDASDVLLGGSLPSMVASVPIVRPAMKVNPIIIFLRA